MPVGIDVYMRWERMTPEEIRSQNGGMAICLGHLGRLREPYHGGPYVTKVLVPEAIDAAGMFVRIPAELLRHRLPTAMKTAFRREREVYGNHQVNEDTDTVQSFVQFVELAEALEDIGERPHFRAVT